MVIILSEGGAIWGIKSRVKTVLTLSWGVPTEVRLRHISAVASLILVEMFLGGSLILLMLKITLVESLALLSKPSVLLLEILLVKVGSLAWLMVWLDVCLTVLRALSLVLALDEVSRDHEWIGIV